MQETAFKSQRITRGGGARAAAMCAAALRTAALCTAALCAPVMARAASPIAEIVCSDTGQMTKKLSRQFGTKPTAWGTRGPEQVMQVWAAETGDWTLVVSYATGTSCIVAMGENWEPVQAENPA